MSVLEQNNYRILVVDDIIDIHKDFRKILISESENKTESLQKMNMMLYGVKSEDQLHLPPFEIDSAFQGVEAINRVREAKANEKPYAVAFIDVQMPPGIDGIDTIKGIWAIDPDVQIVICTAYAKYSWQDLVKNLGISDHLFLLKKPFDQLEIINLACSLTNRWNLNRLVNKSQNLYPKEINLPSASESKDMSAKQKLEHAVDMLKNLNKKLQKNKGS